MMDKASLRRILVSYGIGFFGTMLPLLVISLFLGGSTVPIEPKTTSDPDTTDGFFVSDDDRFEWVNESPPAESPKPTAEANPVGRDSEDVSTPPNVLRTEPLNGAYYVDAANTREIRVVFDRDMNPTASWCEAGDIYPKTIGQSRWIDKRTCVLSVQLESGKNYALSLNDANLTSFRSAEGIALKPVRLAFRTEPEPAPTQSVPTPSSPKPQPTAEPKPQPVAPRPASLGSEMLKVSTFRNGYIPPWKDDDWHLQLDHQGTRLGTIANHSGILRIVCENQVHENPQFFYSPITLSNHTKYRIEIEARSDKSGSLTVQMNRIHPNWHGLGNWPLSLEKGWKTYRFDFVADETSSSYRLRMCLFEANKTYEFRRISLREIDPKSAARPTGAKPAAPPQPVGVPGKDDPQNIPRDKLFWNRSMSGRVSFDYESNNGRCAIGEGIYMFETAWSSCGADSIYAYTDPKSIDGVALAPGAVHPRQIRNAAILDFSSRTRNPKVGQLVVLRNQHGKYAVLGITRIVNKDRTASLRSLLEFTYLILPEGADFGNTK